MQSRVPPAPNDRSDSATEYGSAGTTLDAATTSQSARTTHTPEPDARSAADSSNRQGGSR